MRPALLAVAIVSALALVPVGFVGCAGTDDPTDDGSGVGSAAIVDQVYTVDGWMSLEDDYVPRVCTQENGAAAPEALKAQAVAARTYLLRAMRDDPTLGTESNPVTNGQSFQAWASQANSGCIEATQATRSQVGQYQGELIIANYVAGAYWANGGPTSQDPTSTEHWVTYNDGLTGSAVHPTALSYTSRSDNRGCMSQNGSDSLARAGQSYDAILKYFYGANLEIATLDDGSGSGSGSGGGGGGTDPSDPSGTDTGGTGTDPSDTDTATNDSSYDSSSYSSSWSSSWWTTSTY